MKKINTLLLRAIVLIFPLISYGQIEECATDQKHQQLMQNDANYALTFQKNKALISNYLKQFPKQKSTGTIQIPLVVHIIHTGQSVGVGDNISTNQITTAIDTLNARYSNTHGSSVDTKIEFVLAKRDPNGNPTTGINRVDGSIIPRYATEGIGDGTIGAVESDIKDLSRWPNTLYYNIWVVSEIEDNDGLYGIQGYAYFPGASSNIDGTVIMNTCFGTSGTVNSFNNRNRTLVHEIGHGLSLYHTFQGDNNGTICPSGNGDEVSDTDPHIRASSNCPTGTNSCTGNSIDAVTSNFMNYSSQTCAVNFTSGQSTRMNAALQASRASLISSLGGTTPPSSYAISAACSPNTTNLSNGFGLGIYGINFSNLNLTSGGSVNDGGYVDLTKHQKAITTAGQSYPITINNGSANSENIKAFIDYNNDGDFLDAGETVFSSLGNTSHQGTITIPSSGATLNTEIRMRVISDWASNTISGSCYTPQYGQVEDFALEIYPSTSPLTINITGTSSVSCNGSSDAYLVANESGGIPPYNYAWSNGSTNDSIMNLSAGIYTLTVTDNAGTTQTASQTIVEPTLLSLSAIIKKDSCQSSIGSIHLSTTGGTSPYNYKWDDKSFNTSLINLDSGFYSVTVQDANGCLTSASYFIFDTCFTSNIIAPQNLSVSNLSPTSATLKWDTVTSATTYRVSYSIDGTNNWINKVVNSKTKKAISALTAGVKYKWKVKALVNGTWSPLSSVNKFTTPLTSCVNASNYNTSKIKATSAKLFWTPSSGAKYQLIRYRENLASSWTTVRVGPTRAGYKILGLRDATGYEWQVKTYCSKKVSTAWSSSTLFSTNFGGAHRLKFENSENITSTLSIYPNPSNGLISIDFINFSEEAIKINVYGLDGKLAYSKTERNIEKTNIDLSAFPKGIYIVKVNQGNNQTIEKVIIQ